MTIVRLLDIKEAAGMIGVPAAALREEADRHGKTIKFGRAVKLHPDDILELIELCRVKPKVPASIGGKETMAPQSGKSGMVPPESRPARKASKMLKDSSKRTSSANGGQLVQFSRRK